MIWNVFYAEYNNAFANIWTQQEQVSFSVKNSHNNKKYLFYDSFLLFLDNHPKFSPYRLPTHRTIFDDLYWF